MELTINNKKFIGKYNIKNELIIKLDNKEDVLFFNDWKHKINIPFSKITESGILMKCFAILDLNEEYVKIVYDFYKINTK